MGLIADYLEQCRSRCNAGDLDPCMIINKNFKARLRSYHEIDRTLTAYSSGSSLKTKSVLEQRLIEQASELEAIKTGYLLGEKNILAIYNSGVLHSQLMIDTLRLVLSELQKSYRAICDMRNIINRKIGKYNVVHFEAPSELDICNGVLNMISSSVLYYLEASSCTMDTNEFRMVVLDLAEIIQRLEHVRYNQVPKAVVRNYLKRHFGLSVGYLKCSNCGKPLLNHFPYCLNCYERN